MIKISKPFSIKARIRSIGYAIKGLRILLMYEHNSRIHLLASILVVIAGFVFKISALEWTVVCIAIALVFCFEILNTVVEYLCNFISQEDNENIRRIKDLSAGAVFLAATAAVIVGFIIFVPKIMFIC